MTTVLKTKVRFCDAEAVTRRVGTGGVLGNRFVDGIAGVKAVIHFKFAVSSAAQGTVLLTLPGYTGGPPSDTVTTVTLVTGDVDTDIHVVDKLVTATYTGWVATQSTDTLILTSTGYGPRTSATAPAFALGTATGITQESTYPKTITSGVLDAITTAGDASVVSLGVAANDALVTEDVTVYRNKVVKVKYSAAANIGDPLVITATGVGPAGSTPDARTVVGRCEETMSGAGLGWAYIGW